MIIWQSLRKKFPPLFLLHPIFLYHLHKSVPWDPILSQRIKSTHSQTLPLRFSLILCYIGRLDLQTGLFCPDFMLHWTPGPSNGPFLSRFYATLDAWTFKRAFYVQILCYIGRLDLQTGLFCPDFMLHWTPGPSNGSFLSRFYATLDAWTFKRVFSVQIFRLKRYTLCLPILCVQHVPPMSSRSIWRQ